MKLYIIIEENHHYLSVFFLSRCFNDQSKMKEKPDFAFLSSVCFIYTESMNQRAPWPIPFSYQERPLASRNFLVKSSFHFIYDDCQVTHRPGEGRLKFFFFLVWLPLCWAQYNNTELFSCFWFGRFLKITKKVGDSWLLD